MKPKILAVCALLAIGLTGCSTDTTDAPETSAVSPETVSTTPDGADLLTAAIDEWNTATDGGSLMIAASKAKIAFPTSPCAASLDDGEASWLTGKMDEMTENIDTLVASGEDATMMQVMQATEAFMKAAANSCA